MAHASDYLAARRFDGAPRIGLERMPERVVDGDEEPSVEPLGDLGARKAGAERVAVMEPRRLGGGAVLAGEVGGADGARDRDAVALLGDSFHCQRHGGIGEVDDHVDVIDVEPSAYDGDADIRLVLVIADRHLDGLAEHAPAHVLDRHAGRDHRAGATETGIDARLVVEHTDFDDALRGPRGAREQCGQSEQKIATGGRNGIGLPERLKNGCLRELCAFREVPAMPLSSTKSGRSCKPSTEVPSSGASLPLLPQGERGPCLARGEGSAL